MSKKSHPRESRIIHEKVPQKPPLIISDNLDNSEETIAPELKPEIPKGFKTNDMTSDETWEGEPLSAPVSIPDRDTLTVFLVKSDMVYRFEEYNSDTKLFSSAFWTLLGAIIGVIINWVTQTPIIISKESIIIIGFLIIFGIFSLILWLRNDRKSRKIMDEIKSQEEKKKKF